MGKVGISVNFLALTLNEEKNSHLQGMMFMIQDVSYDLGLRSFESGQGH